MVYLLKQQTHAKVAAISLVIVTLTIFYFNQNKGPESVFRNFNNCLQSKNVKGAEDLCLKPQTPTTLDYLLKRTQNFAALKTNYLVKQSTKKNNLTFLEVLYFFADNSSIVTVWAFKQQNSQWNIDSEHTASIWRNQLGLN